MMYDVLATIGFEDWELKHVPERGKHRRLSASPSCLLFNIHSNIVWNYKNPYQNDLHYDGNWHVIMLTPKGRSFRCQEKKLIT